MVRGLTGTMLKVGTGKITLDDFIQIIENKDSTKADFSVPSQGLFLVNIQY
jgi:tRNA pseudouridine38-40 synthase